MKFGLAILVGAAVGLATTTASAADLPVKAPYVKAAPVAFWTWEIGGRYFGSTGRNRYDYRGGPTAAAPIVSALNYDRTEAHAGEAFFRVDSPIGVFLKGYAGAGSVTKGTLFDEDFPPAFNPTSRTASSLKGDLGYATIDLGYSFYDGRAAGSPVRLGAFIGYNYWAEKYDAFGCTQVNAGGAVCAGAGALPTSVRVITEDDKWNSLRLGGVLDWWITPVWKFTGEAAYIHADQRAVDTHYFTFGRDPASGSGDGFQLEAVIAYSVTSNFNVGVGARYWRLETNAIDRFNQRLEYTTERTGGFIQASYKFETR